MIGAGRDRKEDTIDPAVGVILEVKVGQKIDAGAVLCRIYYTREERLEEAAQTGRRRFPYLVQAPGRAQTDPRSGWLDSMERFTGLLGLVVDSGGGVSVLYTTGGRSSPASCSGDLACSSALPFWF